MAERITQLFFKANRHFVFKKMPLKYSCLLEMDGERIKRGFKHFFGSEIPFRGYKNIPAAAVTLGFERDIILDPFNKIPTSKSTDPAIGEKPDIKSKDNLFKWLAKVATNQLFIYRAKRGTDSHTNWISIALGSVLIIMIIGWLVSWLVQKL